MASRPINYKLEGTIAVPCDIYDWARFMEYGHRIVAKSDVGEARVSTVFLGLDYNFSRDPDADPILFETMIFGFDENYQERCATWAEAETQHAEAVKVAEAWHSRAALAMAPHADLLGDTEVETGNGGVTE